MQPLFAVLVLLGLMACASSAVAQSAYFGNSPKDDVLVTGTATLVAAENQFREALSCTNHDSAVAVRWGDSTVTAVKGQRIPAGMPIEIKSRGAIYMISEDTDVTVSCTEEAR